MQINIKKEFYTNFRKILERYYTNFVLIFGANHIKEMLKQLL